ncbi:esterase E4-like [Penaeus chinensis]|uniref:esterase E4-like n=1 Tax=Penaeus chinensis TaxID=139456 RepID=UPI001FB7EB8A|nr:esterase E4-like [Penaeus chinensis]
MNILRVFSLFFALPLVIVLFVSKTEGSEEGDEEKGRGGREEGLSQFRRGRILNSGAQTVKADLRVEFQMVDLPTSLGIITGAQEFTEQPTSPPTTGRPYFAFRGIPFAEAPTGRLRWEDPEEVEEAPWPGGRLDATQHRPFCPQYDHDANQVVGDEDCLFLNVYTPFLPGHTRERLPVLVFLHDGWYLKGAASSLGPQKLLREDVVLVTTNFRLGALGFLSTGDTTLAGNYGALDQVAALRWVQRNIAQFGGDPNRVTLGGFGSGASFVHLHMLSPLSKGLFSGAIMMSGAGNCPWSTSQEPWEVTYDLARNLGCSTWPSSSLRDCLEEKSPRDILKAQADMHRYVFWPMLFRPSVDGRLREDPFLPESVESLMTQPPASPVPLLIGGVPDEGILLALTVTIFADGAGSPSQTYDEAVHYVFESLWSNSTEDDVATVASAAEAFYYSEQAKDDLSTLAEEMSEAMTDLCFTSCVWDAASYFSASSRSPVYTYLMTHHLPGSPSYSTPLYRLAESVGVRSPYIFSGASHGDDLALIFFLPYELGQAGAQDQQISSLLTFTWATFIHTGSPQSADASTTSLPVWTPLVAGEPVTHYILSFTPGMSARPYRSKERNFWRQTLSYVNEAAESYYPWLITTWVLLALLLLLLVVAAGICVGVWRVRRRDKYPPKGSSSLTLRARRPRNPSLQSSGSGGVANAGVSSDPHA